MLFSAIVALNITCLVCLLKHQTKKADCGVAAWHQFRQIGVHIELDIAAQTDTTLLRLVSNLLVSTLDTHLSSCCWCLEKSNRSEIIHECVFGRCASNLLVAKLTFAVEFCFRHGLTSCLRLKKSLRRVVCVLLLLVHHLVFVLPWSCF